MLSADPAAGLVLVSTPARALPGPVDVVVSQGGASSALEDAFQYLAGARVEAVSPMSGPAAGGTPVTIHLTVTDVDAKFAQAVAAGAEVVMPLDDQFWGDRYGMVRDPFGHQWSLGQPVREVSMEEIATAMQNQG